jgi:hypothetical protein
MAFQIKEGIDAQKTRFVGYPNDPVSTDNVLYIVDVCYLESYEKPIVKEYVF